MEKHTTFRIGGPVRRFVRPASAKQCEALLTMAEEENWPVLVLGNGSNLLAADGGYPGFILKLGGEFDESREDGPGMEAGSAVLLSRLAKSALERGLTGLEFAGGIPGSVGGAITMNAGAYGGEMAQVLEEVTFLDEAGEVCSLPASECGLGYRKSVFSGRKCLILKARFRLEQGDPAVIKARMEELAAKRKEKQPLEYPSAGSMFKRPPGHFAAALIDQCGLKGLTVGGAQVSAKHAGFVVNRGGATCADVLELVRQVQEEVLRQTGVELEMEVKVLR